MCCVFFFKQKTAYEVRISYWSSDVCSSDLCPNARQWHEMCQVERMEEGLADVGIGVAGQRREPGLDCVHALSDGRKAKPVDDQIGRASWRERGGQDV